MMAVTALQLDKVRPHRPTPRHPTPLSRGPAPRPPAPGPAPRPRPRPHPPAPAPDLDSLVTSITMGGLDPNPPLPGASSRTPRVAQVELAGRALNVGRPAGFIPPPPGTPLPTPLGAPLLCSTPRTCALALHGKGWGGCWG